MLLGTHAPKLDEKNRVILPAKFRDELAAGLVLTKGQDRCLYVFSSKEFEAINENIRQAPITSKQARDYLRVFLAGASDEIPDKQGRVTIPQALRQYAGLGKDLVVVGVGSRAEIWDASAWNDYLASQENNFSEISEEVIPGLF
ncbi:MAG: division/cell wall cluster transcriptional repressor MraZ [Actinomycetota bacterium]